MRRPRFSVSRLLPLATLLVVAAAPVFAQDDGSVVVDDLPPPVAEATWCAEDGPGFATRRAFAGRVVFAVQCPGNNANFIQAVVVADDEAGTHARAIVFPTPDPANPDFPNDALSNIRWLDHDELSDLFVDPEETDGPCRHEGRWRLGGEPVTATLLFWRETRDCDGKGGWVVRFGG